MRKLGHTRDAASHAYKLQKATGNAGNTEQTELSTGKAILPVKGRIEEQRTQLDTRS